MNRKNPDSIGEVGILSVEKFEMLLNGYFINTMGLICHKEGPLPQNAFRLKQELGISHVYLDPCAKGRWDPMETMSRPDHAPLGRNHADKSILEAFLKTRKPKCVLLISECCESSFYKKDKIREQSPGVTWIIPDCPDLALFAKDDDWPISEKARQELAKALKKAELLV